MRALFLSAGVLALLAAPAMAQTVQTGPGKVVTGPHDLPSVEPLVNHPTNLNAATTHSVISPALPSANLGPNATAADYLRVAQQALSSNRLGLAQSSLENAETLMLTRSVPMGTGGQPDQSQGVQNINQALQALAAHDTTSAMNLVQQTLSMEPGMTAQAAPPPGAPGMPPPPPPGAVAQ